MNPAAIITEVMTAYDGVDGTDVDNVGRRARYLMWLQHTNNYVHMYREWEWTFATTTLTIIADPLNVAYDGGNAIALPANFLEMSRNGGLCDSTGLKWGEVSVYQMQRLRTEGLGNVSVPVFAIFGGRIQIPYVVTSDLAFTLIYRIAPDVLVDNVTPPVIEMTIPGRYKDLVIIPGLIHRSQESKNDARVDRWAGYFTDGLAIMCARENPLQTKFKQFPGSLPGGMW